MRYVTMVLMLTVLAWAGAATPADAASREQIDARVEEALMTFYDKVDQGQSLARRAAGVLVFPRVTKAGIGIGGEYGEGALIVDGETVDYYSTVSASIGFQLGGQRRTQILLFMTEDALASFRNADGWEVGVDGSVALVEVGAGSDVNNTTMNRPVLGFVMTRGGLMFNANLEGSKISKIER
ncbi:lipid-binding SYLF domain-containing protein [Rhodothalassium salexigens DSM 2132]|uniref:Lipid-binding SYLF domain-containing protein n=1 Tax=Rhodothalassium salexigens DSM 2132 TaxID=1188247 RepID=A0A4R2PU22_RHOSA|nr:YSC84-related protein [Rhodothalassium salexigens]MBB4210374.1 lipid-binding SYLF domain-containing protein [Rhodothalassium salexigens DSM 2132]MBK1638575.1 hypothetical protein [Rhodothalassium salexigens DSM 2132]TCP38538.1 lipid-binding SYLF domain-containing protein [Rhodothalassium salexigens DSM 2132]